MNSRNRVKVNYSPTEDRLLKIMRQRKIIDSATLCELYHNGDNARPWHAQGVINAAMRSLIIKVVYNGEPFIIEKSERRGPHPIEFRLVNKNPGKQAG